jgi:Leucine-rich repeat (LRR) protein
MHLENNVLTEIPAGLRVLGTLRELYLSENELTSLEGSCLPALASLEKLVVSNNKLQVGKTKIS